MASDEDPTSGEREVARYEVPSRLEERFGVIDSILVEIEAAAPDTDLAITRLCIDEALVNAIVHGNTEDPRRRVRIRLLIGDRHWVVEIEDEGPGFDWKELLRRLERGMDPGRPSERGVALIIASGAQVGFSRGGRAIRIRRELGGRDSGPHDP